MKTIICGPGASGKDFLKKKFLSKGLRQSISYTTRPMRDGETHGVDYFFVTEEVFKQMINNREFREYNIFGDKNWYYGTTKKEFDEASLFIMTPSGIAALAKSERDDCFVIYIDIDEDIRLKRLKKRKDADNPERRIQTDRDDFKYFTDYDLKVSNADF